MALFNEWVGYTTRSYNQIKTSVLTKLGIKVPEITDHSESNPLVIIISIFAGIAEMLNYYIDNVARESFISTARRFSSMVKLVKLIDYRIKAANPASVDLIITFLDSSGNPIGASADYTILSGTEFATGNNINFISVTDILVLNGDINVQLGVEQKTQLLNQNLGLTSGVADQNVSIGLDYVDGSMALEVDGNLWELKDTLGRSTPLDQHYIIEISVNKVAFIKFGDGINGVIPSAGLQLIADYYTTLGSEGNVDPNTITTIVSTLIIPGVDTLEVNNSLKAVAGTEYEDVERIRKSAPISLRTLSRAVTRSDYKDIALLANGVDKASVHFICGKTVNIYISPIGGGIAQSALLQSTKDFVDERKMITTFIDCFPAGETYIALELNVTAKFRMDGNLTELDIREKLLDEYGYDKSDINKPIRLSDIIAMVDNLNKVDFLTLISLSTIPYARPDNHVIELNWNRSTLNSSNQIINWKLNYNGTLFRLYREGVFITNINIGNQYTTTDNVLQLTINASTYIAGMDWNFKTYPYTENIELDDYSVPILRDQDLTLIINEQLTIN